MPTTKEIGNWAEEKAAQFLIQNGHEILERNYKFGRYEVDIISSHSGWIHFNEVKYRNNTTFGNPENFLSSKQKDRIQKAAEHYTFNINFQGNIRFNIIALNGKKDKCDLVFLEDV